MYGSKDHYTSTLKSEHPSKKKNTISFDFLSCHCTKLYFDSLLWQNAEKNSTSVPFSNCYKYITSPIHSKSVLGHGRSSNACNERDNKYFTLKRWGEIGVLYTKSRLNFREGKCVRSWTYHPQGREATDRRK